MRAKLSSLLVLLFACTVAHADSYSQAVSFTGLTSLPLNKFDLSMGTLTSFTLNASISGYASSPLNLVFETGLGTPIFAAAATSSSAQGFSSVSGSGTITDAADLAAISNPHNFLSLRYQFDVQSLNSLVGANIMGGGTVTFNYTPAAATPEIDPSLAASGLILLAGAIIILRERRLRIPTWRRREP